MNGEFASSAQDSRRLRIIAAATDVFVRHGFAKTSMGDIAERAGISRASLYLVFHNKDHIFSAALERMSGEQLAGIRAHLRSLDTLEDRLQYACQTWGMHGFELIEKHPDASDLFDIRREPVIQVYAAFQELIAELIAAHIDRTTLTASPAQLARALTFGMRGFKDTAADVSEMQDLIGVLVSVFVYSLGLPGKKVTAKRECA